MHKRFNPTLFVFASVALLLFIPLAFFPTPTPTHAQAGLSELLTLSVRAGYDGAFRGNMWLPVRVEVANDGDDLDGVIVVRPETSGSAITNTFTAPVSLPNGSRQALFLYISARAGATRVRVELLNTAGDVMANVEAPLRSIASRDRLYAVVSGAAAGTVIDLTPVASGGYSAHQAAWRIEDIPDRAPALDALDALVFNDVDTGTLAPRQRTALREWVAQGGHLIVTGGAAWQPTAAGLRDLLPLVPEDSQTISDVSALVRYAGDYATQLSGDILLATGTLSAEARVLVATDDGLPLLVRRTFGGGTLDYLALDPNNAPLRTWPGRSDVWLTLLTSVPTAPAWAYGFKDYTRAEDAVEILPGLDLLPAALGLLLFLAAYVGLVGPVNYLILNRLNRREWAWITIPVLIVAFSFLARVAGFNLRGNEITLSRLTVIQSWPGSDTARIEQLTGLLAPRRDEYALGVTEERMLRSLPIDNLNAQLIGQGSGRTQIRQTDDFSAVDFQVDASFIAAFNASGSIPSPDISGRAVLTYAPNTVSQVLRGAVSNRSERTLYDPVLLARGIAWSLGETLEPGEVREFSDIFLGGGDLPQPGVTEIALGEESLFSAALSFTMTNSYYGIVGSQTRTTNDILGDDVYIDENDFFGTQVQSDEDRRRQAFLASFVVDQYGSTGRGNQVFLAAWGEGENAADTVSGAGWSAVDTTLYLIALDVEIDATANRSILITRDQFTWIARERGANDLQSAPFQLGLTGENEAVFRFTPLQEAVLSEVDALTLIVERQSGTRNSSEISLWNWREQQWEPQQFIDDTGRLEIRRPERYLGPNNAVEVRVGRSFVGARVDISLLAVEQRGRF